MTTPNPYESPLEPTEAAPPYDGKLPTSAYASAGCSGMFVFVGTMFAGGAFIMLVAPTLARLVAVTFLILLFVALGLGLISGWEALRLAQRKLQKQYDEQNADKPDATARDN
ncbi:MAG TPA: hypothetical protein VL096_17370 [Pirellulaceae bacterium]|nr:hypothetical protein [Pirellulaceae bacterium]